jgi:hypothetical protein
MSRSRLWVLTLVGIGLVYSSLSWAQQSSPCSNPTIVGTMGDDVLTGTEGPDVIDGLGGDDTIAGLGDDDLLCGSEGRDQIFGGEGDDAIFGGLDSDKIQGDGGDDTLVGGEGDDEVRGSADQDSADGGRDSDHCDAELATACETALASELPARLPGAAQLASAASPAHQQHTMSITGAYAIGQYTRNGTGYDLQAYVHDTKPDGYCAQVWLDFTTFPHEHHGPLMTYACGNNVRGWGANRHANSPQHKIKSFRMAVCRAKEPWVRYSSGNQVSRPVGCRAWPSGQSADWAVHAWRASDLKITPVH